jgi:hypothetical protein
VNNLGQGLKENTHYTPYSFCFTDLKDLRTQQCNYGFSMMLQGTERYACLKILNCARCICIRFLKPLFDGDNPRHIAPRNAPYNVVLTLRSLTAAILEVVKLTAGASESMPNYKYRDQFRSICQDPLLNNSLFLLQLYAGSFPFFNHPKAFLSMTDETIL